MPPNHIIGYSIIVLNIAVFYYLLPSALQPVLWEYPTPVPVLEGPTAPNSLLSNAYEVPGNYDGPESIAFDPETGFGYVSFSDGGVGAFDMNGKLFNRIFFSGGFVSSPQQKRTNGMSDDKRLLLNWCNAEAKAKRLAWDIRAEKKCGRPLGLRFRKEDGTKYLYILDAYHGLFKLNLDTSTAQHLVSTKATIDLPTATAKESSSSSDIKSSSSSSAGASDGSSHLQKVPRFYNDLDITADGRIIYSDTSYLHTRSENRKDIMDAAPRGRLFEFNPRTSKVTVLMCGLHFPNGVQLLAPSTATTADVDVVRQTAVIVNELTRFRALKIDVDSAAVRSGRYTSNCGERSLLWSTLMEQGPMNAFQREIDFAVSGVTYFNELLPGLPDNVRLDTKPAHWTTPTPEQPISEESYYIFGLGSKHAKPLSLLWIAYQSVWLRDFIGKLIPMQWVEKLVPKYGLVVVTDSTGNIVDSLHDPTGEVHFISQADRNPFTGDLWMGSHSEKLTILPAQFVPKQWGIGAE